jgi:hypothetical protein
MKTVLTSRPVSDPNCLFERKLAGELTERREHLERLAQ